MSVFLIFGSSELQPWAIRSINNNNNNYISYNSQSPSKISSINNVINLNLFSSLRKR